MISTRQFRILYHLFSLHQEDPLAGVSIGRLAEEHDVTTRTIRTDLDAIDAFVREGSMGVTLDRARGASLAVRDEDRASAFMADTIVELQKVFYFVDDYARAKYIVETVLLSKKHVKLEKLANDLFISQSRLSQDLKTVTRILERYNLTLEKVKGTGIRILGDPLDKRTCLMKEATIALADDIEYVNNQKYRHMIDMASEIVTDVMVARGFNVSDVTLQNIVVHVAATVEMLLRGSTVEGETSLDDTYDSQELAIATEILERFAKRCGIRYTPREAEVLAVNIHGKREYDKDDFIADEINGLVVEGLAKVRAVYGYDFLENLELRIALALHLNPLRARLRNNSQVVNSMTLYIKQNYSLPFEMATTFLAAALPSYAEIATDDELSYLACHFSVAVSMAAGATDERRAVIVTRDKKSGVLLLQQHLRQKFPAFSHVEVTSAYSQGKTDLSGYDCVLVTDRDLAGISPNAIYVRRLSFDEDEERRVAFAAAGFDVERDLMPKFDRRLFRACSAADKGDAMRKAFSLARDAGLAGDEVLESVLRHEESASSYFGNRLAIPHSETLLSSCERSFISVLTLDRAITWDGYDVDMVMLMVLHEDDPVRYQMWNYISLMISKPEYMDALRRCRDFDSFVFTVRAIYKLAL